MPKPLIVLSGRSVKNFRDWAPSATEALRLVRELMKLDGSINGLLNRFGAGLSRVDGFGGRRDWAFLWRAAAPPPWTAALGAHGAAMRSR